MDNYILDQDTCGCAIFFAKSNNLRGQLNGWFRNPKPKKDENILNCLYGFDQYTIEQLDHLFICTKLSLTWDFICQLLTASLWMKIGRFC